MCASPAAEPALLLLIAILPAVDRYGSVDGIVARRTALALTGRPPWGGSLASSRTRRTEPAEALPHGCTDEPGR